MMEAWLIRDYSRNLEMYLKHGKAALHYNFVVDGIDFHWGHGIAGAAYFNGAFPTKDFIRSLLQESDGEPVIGFVQVFTNKTKF